MSIILYNEITDHGLLIMPLSSIYVHSKGLIELITNWSQLRYKYKVNGDICYVVSINRVSMLSTHFFVAVNDLDANE